MRRVFAEIFKSIECIRALLDFIKYNKCFMRSFMVYYFVACHHQILHYTINILGALKKLSVFRMLVKVEVCHIFVMLPCKFLQKPSLTYLARSFQNKRLSVFRVFPFNKFFHNKPLHKTSPFQKSHYYTYFVYKNHIFIYNYSLFIYFSQ